MIKSKEVRKVIIPVGGFGTRFLPATKAQPKEMLPVVDKPVIQYLVEEAVASGMKEVVLVTGRGKRAIEDHFDHAAELETYLESRGKTDLAQTVRKISSMALFSFVRQKEPNGIGDAILQARHLIGNEPVAVMAGDDIFDAKTPALKQLIKVYERYRAPVVALRRVPQEDIHKYGIIAGKNVAPRVWSITRSVEKPKVGEKAPSDLMIVVKYVLTPDFFDYIARVKPAPNGEIYPNLAIEKYVRDGKRFYGYEIKGEYYDCGDKLGYMKAAVHFALKHPEIGKEFQKYLQSFKS